MAHRSGFVALVGRPNVGKSTVLNRLLGAKVAITSPVPQTTRTVVRGVLTRPEAQIIFVDTPGIHQPRHKLGEWMVEKARHALREVDLIVWMVDGAAGLRDEDRTVADAVRAVQTPRLIVVNKVDHTGKARADQVAREAAVLAPAETVLYVSGMSGEGLDDLLIEVIRRLPEGPQYYPEEMLTDQPEQFLVREFIREQAIHHTREEVPHAVAVEMEEYTERPDGTLYIRATIHVEKPSQKGILLGKGGSRLKAIGTAARQQAEALLGRKVFLDLWVTVTRDWRDKPALIRGFYPE